LIKILSVTMPQIIHNSGVLEIMHSHKNMPHGDGSNLNLPVMLPKKFSELLLIHLMKEITVEQIPTLPLESSTQTSIKSQIMFSLQKLLMVRSNYLPTLSESNKTHKTILLKWIFQNLMPLNGHSFILLIVSQRRPSRLQ
jgi:hypothetical protein